VPPLAPAAVADAVRRLDNKQLREGLVATGRRVAERPAAGYVRGVIDFVDEFAGMRRG
jgi:hypothetical protein